MDELLAIFFPSNTLLCAITLDLGDAAAGSLFNRLFLCPAPRVLGPLLLALIRPTSRLELAEGLANFGLRFPIKVKRRFEGTARGLGLRIAPKSGRFLFF